MTMQLQLRKDQIAIDGHFKATTIRRDERDRLDHMLVILHQLVCQAHGPIGIVSDRAVNDFDFQHTSSYGVRQLVCPKGYAGENSRSKLLDSKMLGDYIIAAIPARTPAPFHPPGVI